MVWEKFKAKFVYNWLDPLSATTLVYFIYLMFLLAKMSSYETIFPWIAIPLIFIPISVSFVPRDEVESAIFTANSSVALFLWILNVIAPVGLGEVKVAVIVLFLTGLISLFNSSGIKRCRFLQLILPSVVLFAVFIVFLFMGMTRAEPFSQQQLFFIKSLRYTSMFFFCMVGRKSNLQKDQYMMVMGLRSIHFNKVVRGKFSEGVFVFLFIFAFSLVTTSLLSLAVRLSNQMFLVNIAKLAIAPILVIGYEWAIFEMKKIEDIQ